VGRPRKWSLREILDSIFSVLRGGRGLAGYGLTIFPPGKRSTTLTGCGGCKAFGWTLEIVKHPWSGQQSSWAPKEAPPRVVEVPKGFIVLKRRWVVERTFAWLGKSRRMARDDEALPETAENLVYEVMIRLMVRRLAKGPP
jgi:Transposase DDE domain